MHAAHDALAGKVLGARPDRCAPLRYHVGEQDRRHEHPGGMTTRVGHVHDRLETRLNARIERDRPWPIEVHLRRIEEPLFIGARLVEQRLDARG